MGFVQFFSAFGLGALVTAFVQAWLARRAYVQQRNFQEKKECYVGFLDALHQSGVERTETAALNVGHWQNRIELVGSPAVQSACVRINETNPVSDEVHPERAAALRALKNAMKVDLGVTR